MAGFRKPEVPRDQLVLWSVRLDDAIPADHPVRHVAYLLESEPFSRTFREWERSYVLLEGKPPYPPRDLTGLYVYGMMNRVRSSRQLEAACYNRVDVLWLMSGQHPDHSTIAEFVSRHGKGRITKEAFRYDAEADGYVCPMGRSLGFLRNSQDRKNWGVAIRAQYGGCRGCATCPRAKLCCSNPSQGRMINRDQYEGYRERMRARMKSDEGRSRYRLRGETVERRFGHIKRGLGIRRFMRRGMEKVRTEWSVICAVVNMGIPIGHWSDVVKVLE